MRIKQKLGKQQSDYKKKTNKHTQKKPIKSSRWENFHINSPEITILGIEGLEQTKTGQQAQTHNQKYRGSPREITIELIHPCDITLN